MTAKSITTRCYPVIGPSAGTALYVCMMLLWAALLPASAQAGSTAAPDAPPQRVVSINLCMDQFLLDLADPSQIASLTYMSHNPQVSLRWKEARRYPANHVQTEEVIRYNPDLILSGMFTRRIMARALEVLGYRLLSLPPATSFAEIRTQIRTIAAALGQPARGESLITEMDQRLSELAAGAPAQRQTGAIYHVNSLTFGAGTLEDDILRAAAIDNLATRLKWQSWRYMPLETLLVEQPDIVILGQSDPGPPSLARRFFEHPALAAFARKVKVVAVPRKLWACGTHQAVEAVALLAKARDAAPGTVDLKSLLFRNPPSNGYDNE